MKIRKLILVHSVQFSRSVVSDSLQPHESQHVRPPCPSPTPGVHPNSCASSRWCHPAISSSVVPFSSCPQSLPESESFPTSQLFTWGGPSIGVSALASVLPKNTHWTHWLDLLAVQGTLKSLLQHHSSKASILWRSAFFTVHYYHLILRSHSVFTSCPHNVPYSKMFFIIKESSLESHLAFYLSRLFSLFQSETILQSLTFRILALWGLFRLVIS